MVHVYADSVEVWSGDDLRQAIDYAVSLSPGPSIWIVDGERKYYLLPPGWGEPDWEDDYKLVFNTGPDHDKALH